MRKIREIIRLASSGKLSRRQIAGSCRVSPTTASKVVEAAKAVDLLRWPLPEMTESELRAALFGTEASSIPSKPLPDMEQVAKDLSRRGVTRRLLWEEYRLDHPEGYGYTQFCEYLRQWSAKQDPTMRFEHAAGEKLFVDWAGQTIGYDDQAVDGGLTGYLFVAVLGASNYTFASVYADMKLASWIRAHMDALSFLGGVPELIVPDNTRTAVSKACFYDPDLNRTYHDLAEHYNTVILPTRVRRPRDKAKAEAAVQNAERRILAALRNCQFLSFGELRQAVREKNRALNDRPFAKISGSRSELFEAIDAPALKPLPQRPFTLGEWQDATVYKDYHIQVDYHFYSVPHQYVGKRVEVRKTDRIVEIYHDGVRLATHKRSMTRGKASTLPEHRTKAHRGILQRDAQQFIDQAGQIGPHCREAVAKIFDSVPHPEMGFRGCAGILRLSREHGRERLDAACRRALHNDVVRYATINRILKNGLENEPDQEVDIPVVQHRNLRGPSYYCDREVS